MGDAFPAVFFQQGVEKPGLAGDEDVGDERGVCGGTGEGYKIEAADEIEALPFRAFPDEELEQSKACAGCLYDGPV